MTKLKIILCLLAVCVLYFILRLGWQDTIEFGYDQPLLSMRVLDFLSKPTFLRAYDFVSYNPWGFPSWGVGQIFFWAPFFLVSQDPIFLSNVAAVFNFSGVLFTFWIGRRFFSTKIGLIAAVILTLHPWSIIFSRMVYQPTPVATLVAISMFLSFTLLEKQKSRLLPMLIFSWAVLIQVYVHTASFVVGSLAIFLLSLKKVVKRYFFIGLFLSLLLFLPTIIFFTNAPQETFGFLRVSQKFEELRGISPYAPRDIIFEFFGTLAGGRLNWQLGYGYESFVKSVPLVLAEKIGIVFVILIFIYNAIRAIKDKETRIKQLALIFWSIGPIWFLSLIKTPIALPRYFLLSLPAFSLLVGIFIVDTAKKIKIVSYIVLIGVASWWIFLIGTYYSFIGNFNYSKGFLSYYADVPYSFLDKSFKWIKEDAKKKSYDSFIVSDDPSNPRDIRLNSAQTYYWTYVLNKNFSPSFDGAKTGYYLMYFSPLDKNYNGEYAQFGPYIIYEVRN